MRREERTHTGPELETLFAGLRCRRWRQAAGSHHSREDHPLAGHGEIAFSIRIEGGRALRKARKEGGLRRRQHARRRAEVGPARPLEPADLVPVRGKVQVQGEDLPLGQAVLETKRHDGFPDLRGPAAPAIRGGPQEGQLCDLLRDGGSPLSNPPFDGIPPRSTEGRQRIDPWMRPEAMVLCGHCGGSREIGEGVAP